MFISNAYAQAAAGGMEQQLLGFLPIILMFVVLWFLMIRPQMKRAKEFGVGLDTRRQFFLSAVSLAFHDRAPGFDTTEVLRDLEDEVVRIRRDVGVGDAKGGVDLRQRARREFHVDDGAHHLRDLSSGEVRLHRARP